MSTTQERKICKFLQIGIALIGISTSVTPRCVILEKCFEYFFITIVPFFTFGFAHAFWQHQELIHRLEVIRGFTLLVILFIAKFFAFPPKQLWREFYTYVTTPNDILDEKFFDKCDQDAREMVRIIYGLLIGVQCYLLVPFIGSFFVNMHLDPIDKLIMPITFPWTDTTSATGNFIAFVGQAMIILIPGTTFIGIGCLLTFYLIFIINLEKNICDKIQKLDPVKRSLNVDNFHQIIFLHRTMIALFRRMLPFLVSLIHVAVLMFFSSGILDTVIILNAKLDDIFRFIKLADGILLVFWIFVTSCEIGTIIECVNDNICLTLYTIRWYESSLQFQKLFFHFLTLIQWKLNLRVFGVNNISRIYFTRAIRFTYSAIQVTSKVESG